jgi:cbb3-type cytochrome oxidase cytochrome c subunit
VELKDGKLTAAKLLKKSKVFEEKTLKMPINIVTGIPVEEDDNTEEEQTTSSSEETATSDTTSTSKMSPEERTQHHKRLENLTAFFNKLANQ